MHLSQNERHYLYHFNSLAVFWFFAFVIVGPKYTLATSALLVLSVITLPGKVAEVRVALRDQLPWVLGLTIYCVYHVVYRYLEGVPLDKLDPPFRYLAAIPILVYLQIYRFSATALGLGAAVGCFIGGGAGIYEVLSGQAARAGTTIAHHPIPYGTLVTLLAMCALYGATIASKIGLRAVLALGAGVGLVAAFYSGTRGLYPAILLAVSYLGYRNLRARNIGRGRIALTVAATSMIIAVTAYQLPAVEKRIALTASEVTKISGGNLNTSFGHRLQMWHTAAYLFSEEPVFGAGFDKSARSAKAAGFLAEHGYHRKLLDIYDHLHSEYLHTLAAYGTTGFIVLLALLLGAIRGLPATGNAPTAMVLIVIAVESLTEAVFVDTKLTTAFIFFVTALRAQTLWQTRSAVAPVAHYDAPFRIPQTGL